MESVGVADAFKRAAPNRPLFTKKERYHCCYSVIKHSYIYAYVIHAETRKDTAIVLNIALEEP